MIQKRGPAMQKLCLLLINFNERKTFCPVQMMIADFKMIAIANYTSTSFSFAECRCKSTE